MTSELTRLICRLHMGSGSRKNSAVVILIVAARYMNGGVELIKRSYPRFAQKVGGGMGEKDSSDRSGSRLQEHVVGKGKRVPVTCSRCCCST